MMNGNDDNTEMVNAFVTEGFQYILNKDFDNLHKALECFENAIEVEPDNGFYYYLRGYVKSRFAILVKMGTISIEDDMAKTYKDWRILAKSSIEDFNKAVGFGYEKAELYKHKSESENLLGLSKSAIKSASKGIASNVGNGDLYVARGIAKFNLRQDKEAVEDFNVALEINKRDFTALQWRSMCYKELGDLEKSESDMNECKKMRKEAQERIQKQSSINKDESEESLQKHSNKQDSLPC